MEDCIQQEKEETFIFQMVQEGNSVEGLYPMNKDWQSRYEKWVAAEWSPRQADHLHRSATLDAYLAQSN